MSFYIKPYASCSIPVQIEKMDYDSLKKISFIFSRGLDSDLDDCIIRTWTKEQKEKGEEGWQIKYASNNTFHIKLSGKETAKLGKFVSDSITKTGWLDVRPVYLEGSNIEKPSWATEECAPATKPISFKIIPTLFSQPAKIEEE